MAGSRASRDADGRLRWEPAAGDRVRLRRAHVCGAAEMVVTRVALDIRLSCSGCGAHLVLDRSRLRSRVAAVLGTVSDAGAVAPPATDPGGAERGQGWV